jgi:hypothetical protein
MGEPKKGGEIMRILFISLLLLTLVGCAHSNLALHKPALYYNDSNALAEQNRQQYLDNLNREQNSIPFKNGGATFNYTLLNW